MNDSVGGVPRSRFVKSNHRKVPACLCTTAKAPVRKAPWIARAVRPSAMTDGLHLSREMNGAAGCLEMQPIRCNILSGQWCETIMSDKFMGLNWDISIILTLSHWLSYQKVAVLERRVFLVVCCLLKKSSTSFPSGCCIFFIFFL